MIRSSGEPFHGSIGVVPNDGSAVLMPTTSVLRSDGSFEIARLIPGTYEITARDRTTTSSPSQEVGHVIVTVGTEDVGDVVIVTGNAGVARGRVVTEDGSVPGVRPSRMTIATAQAPIACGDRTGRHE